MLVQLLVALAVMVHYFLPWHICAPLSDNVHVTVDFVVLAGINGAACECRAWLFGVV
jgi:hypothetical protein